MTLRLVIDNGAVDTAARRQRRADRRCNRLIAQMMLDRVDQTRAQWDADNKPGGAA